MEVVVKIKFRLYKLFKMTEHLILTTDPDNFEIGKTLVVTSVNRTNGTIMVSSDIPKAPTSLDDIHTQLNDIKDILNQAASSLKIMTAYTGQ